MGALKFDYSVHFAEMGVSGREPLSWQHKQDVSNFAQGTSEPECLSNALSGQLMSASPVVSALLRALRKIKWDRTTSSSSVELKTFLSTKRLTPQWVLWGPKICLLTFRMDMQGNQLPFKLIVSCLKQEEHETHFTYCYSYITTAVALPCQAGIAGKEAPVSKCMHTPTCRAKCTQR